MKNVLEKWTVSFYISLLCAEGYEDQEPQIEFIKWYDIFWLLIPVCGFLFLDEAVSSRYKKVKQITG